jgi:hypothetical protein
MHLTLNETNICLTTKIYDHKMVGHSSIIPLLLLFSALHPVQSSLRRSRKLHRVHENLAIANQYIVFRHGQRPSWALENLRERRLFVDDSSSPINVESPLRIVTLQDLSDQDLLSLIDDDEVAFVEQVSCGNFVVLSHLFPHKLNDPYLGSIRVSCIRLSRPNIVIIIIYIMGVGSTRSGTK